jgi:hypothetical protein
VLRASHIALRTHHVEGLFVLTNPLNDLTTPYKKSSSIVWTPQLEELFKQTQEAVGNCPKLYYVDNDLSIHVRADASDYGIGGYIFQKNGHKELPIRFISKSLHKSQLNWSTIEKEAFAIFYTVTKYDFLFLLLRDVKFTIEADHKNLTYLKTAQSAKVRRWQLALQEYDFTCILIAGEANVVADAFSRLCERRPSFDADADDKAGPPLDVLASLGDINPPPVTTEPSIPPLLWARLKPFIILRRDTSAWSTQHAWCFSAKE